MTAFREEILKATSEAQLVLKNFPVGNRTSFDILDAVIQSDIEVVFRNLTGLWGATIAFGEDTKGILVTTKIPLSVQRFTLAHEFGHVLLGHELSIDKEVSVEGRFNTKSLPVEEIAANVFASELLASKGLMLKSAKRHNWDSRALMDPVNVYQLSLRLGISYTATCWALASHKALTPEKATALQAKVVKDLKLSLVPPHFLSKAKADVWKLSEKDDGTYLEAGPEDLFVLKLRENSSAGYLWELVDAGDAEILGSEIELAQDLFGAASSKALLIRFPSPGVHRLVFQHTRPWNGHQIGFIDVGINNYGREELGEPRRIKELRLREAA